MEGNPPGPRPENRCRFLCGKNRANALAEPVGGHAVDILLEYGPLVPILIHDFVDYVQDENTCPQQSSLDCGAGTCSDIIVHGLGGSERFCASDGTYVDHCACMNMPHRDFGCNEDVIGFNTVTITVDPDDLGEEIDETNNTMIISLSPVAAEPTSWGEIKGMYR